MESSASFAVSSAHSEHESVNVPLIMDTMSFESRQSVGLKDMEKRVEADIRRKRKSWEKEIERMRNEFLMLYPTDRVWGSEELLNDPLVAKRRGSTDILDLKKMKTAFLDYPDVGRKFRIRFNVRDYDPHSIQVSSDGERIIVRANKKEALGPCSTPSTTTPTTTATPTTATPSANTSSVQEKEEDKKSSKGDSKEINNNTTPSSPSLNRLLTSNENDKKHSVPNLNSSQSATTTTTTATTITSTTAKTTTATTTATTTTTATVMRTYERKVQKPKEVDASKFKSYLTSDHILIVEAPLRGRSSYHDLRRPSPASSAHFSAVGLNNSPGGSRSPSNSPGQDTPSKDKIGVPTFREENGQRRLVLLVDMGSIFKPQDITVQVIKDNKIWIWAKHEEKTAERLTKSKFSKEYELGEKIEIHSVTGVLAPDGRLSVGAFAKGHGNEEVSKSDDEKASCSGGGGGGGGGVGGKEGIKQIQSCVDLVQTF